MSENKDKMTFTQFCALANRKLDLNQDYVYRYESFEISEICPSHPYPEFELWCRDNIMFKTFDEAVRYMHDNIIRSTESGHDFYCHVITVIPWGTDTRVERTKFLYDYKGDLLDYTFTGRSDDMKSTVFLGRTPDRIRFKRGDFVEVRNDDTVRLGIIWYPETSVAECWDLYKDSDDKEDPYRCLSTCDDECVVIYGSDYFDFGHVSPTDIMLPTFRVDDNLRGKLLNCLKESIESETGSKDRILL